MQVLEKTIRDTFPLIRAPIDGYPEPPERNGTRYVAAADGLWREIELPWIKVVHQVARSDIALPFGKVKPTIEVRCSNVPQEVRMRFFHDAVRALPNEAAGALIWNDATDSWRYEMRVTKQATPVSVQFHEPKLGPNEHLVLDVHSHGNGMAFFSQDDDADDQGTMRFSGVIGNLTDDEPSSVLRLNMLGYTWPAVFGRGGKLEVPL